jgi:PKD repeat protein
MIQLRKNLSKIMVLTVLTACIIGLLIVLPIIPQLEKNNTSHVEESLLKKTFPSEKIHLVMRSNGIGNITINVTIPETPKSIPLYWGTFQNGDSFKKSFQSYAKIRFNVTSEKDAPDVAQQVMAEYGGIPIDAILGETNTSYAESRDRNTNELVEKYPVMTSVNYYRMLNNLPIAGTSDNLRIDLGENGEPIAIRKNWRTIENTGYNVSIVSAITAIEKLENGELLNPSNVETSSINGTSIDYISLAYYERSRENVKVLFEPVWIFWGTTESGDLVNFVIYARQFANFTTTPTSGKIPLAVNFADTSDASPMKWYWDFGDGSNSTEQNPTHTYTTTGTYNVSLKAWNDLGSDTMEKTDFVTVRNPAPPVANFTASLTTGFVPLSVIFNDTSTNIPTSWQWDFGDGTNATVQNLTHTYSAPGNYTVSLNVTNDDGTDEITRSDYITVTNLPPTTQPTMTTVTTIPTTTRPGPTRTHTPLSLVPVITALFLTGLLTLMWRWKIS